MAKKKAQEPRNRSDSETGIERPKRPAVTSKPSSGPIRAPASRPVLGFKPELIFVPGGHFTMGSDIYGHDDVVPSTTLLGPDSPLALKAVKAKRYVVSQSSPEMGRLGAAAVGYSCIKVKVLTLYKRKPSAVPPLLSVKESPKPFEVAMAMDRLDGAGGGPLPVTVMVSSRSVVEPSVRTTCRV